MPTSTTHSMSLREYDISCGGGGWRYEETTKVGWTFHAPLPPISPHYIKCTFPKLYYLPCRSRPIAKPSSSLNFTQSVWKVWLELLCNSSSVTYSLSLLLHYIVQDNNSVHSWNRNCKNYHSTKLNHFRSGHATVYVICHCSNKLETQCWKDCTATLISVPICSHVVTIFPVIYFIFSFCQVLH